MVVAAMDVFSNGKALLGRLMEARRRRVQQDREFYRILRAYCRANNLPCACADDWKTAAYADSNDSLSTVHSKGNVSCEKMNLPR
jgi:hypothetical protein